MEHDCGDDVPEESLNFDDEHRDHDEVLGRDRDRDRAEAAGTPDLALPASDDVDDDIHSPATAQIRFY